MKAQTAVEFVLVFAIIIAFVAAILLTGFKQSEVVLAAAAGRSAGVDCAAEKGLILGQLENATDAVDTAKFTITARFYDGFGNPTAADECKGRMADAINRTLGGHSQDCAASCPESLSGSCPRGGYYYFCVV